jgi:hypothetical protein
VEEVVSRIRAAAVVLIVSAGLALSTATPAFAANVTSHGGPGATGLSAPKIFIDWWGPEWQAGFSTGGYSSSRYQAYLRDFLNALVADPTYLGLMGQYGVGTTISLGGEWTDTSSDPPNDFNFSQISGEVAAAALHFGDSGANYTPNDIILVALPSGRDSNQFAANGGPACAYHNLAPGLALTSGITGPTPFIDLDYQPDALGSCYGNATNAFNDAFGHGIFDNVSTATGHELAELLTDYDVSTGWYGASGEVGDPCVSNFTDFGPPTGYPLNGFAVSAPLE